MTDRDRTNPETPISKSFKPGLESCPCCLRTGVHLGVQCLYCGGGRVVPTDKADKWRAAHAPTDPAPDESWRGDPVPGGEDGGRKA
jgi:hypothetical protein